MSRALWANVSINKGCKSYRIEESWIAHAQAGALRADKAEEKKNDGMDFHWQRAEYWMREAQALPLPPQPRNQAMARDVGFWNSCDVGSLQSTVGQACQDKAS